MTLNDPLSDVDRNLLALKEAKEEEEEDES